MLWPDDHPSDEPPVDSASGIDFGWQPTRRLPVYLLLDVSASMHGAPIMAVNEGVKLLYDQLIDTPTAVETVWMSIITFGTKAIERVKLTPLTEFQPVELEAGGTTSLGAAFRLLEGSLDNEVRAGTETEKGDWRPLVYLLTDGEPTDDWEPAVQRILTRTEKRVGTIVALACGENVDEHTLKQITSHVVRMENVSVDYLKSFFKWVSQSVSGASVSAEAAGRTSQLLPPLPEGLSTI
jgi:uncharacterized protein YegL